MRVLIDSYAWLQKSDLSSAQLEGLRTALTVRPRKVGDHPGEPPGPISLFSENAAVFGMPRQFFLGRRKPAHQVEFRTTEGDKSSWPGDLSFVGTLREEQTRGLHTVYGLFKAGSLGGIVQAVPGFGKTVLSCALIAKLQVPTLVVVHKEFLMDQWRERLLQYLPRAKIGTVQAQSLEYEGCHVVMGMMQTLAIKDYGAKFNNYFGLIVLDEVHRVGAETWAPVPVKFAAKWKLGLSATPRRKDGADAVFRYHIGDVIFTSKEVRMSPKVRKVWITPDVFKVIHTANFNPSLIKKGLLLRFMCASVGRNRVIVSQIVQAVKAGRKCLVLSDRLQHLRDMEMMLYAVWEDPSTKPSVGFYIGGETEESLEVAAKAQVIFATTQLVSEGLDIPPLDTIFLTCPASDVEQSIGRILRPFEGKKEPIVVDFRENHIGLCKRYADYRDKFYEKQGWVLPGPGPAVSAP